MILLVSSFIKRGCNQKLIKISVLGALLGTQTGREVEIVNTFELAFDENPDGKIIIDSAFLISRLQQCELGIRAYVICGLIFCRQAGLSVVRINWLVQCGTRTNIIAYFTT